MSKVNVKQTGTTETNITKKNTGTTGIVKATEQSGKIFHKISEITDEQRTQIFEDVLSEPKDAFTMAAIREQFIAMKINLMPSEHLVNSAVKARREFANGMLSLVKAKDIVNATYDMAVKEGYTPKIAKKVVTFLVSHGEMAIMSERTVRNYLPDIAKDTSKGSKEKPRNEPREKTEEEQQGLEQIYVPLNLVKEIAEFAKRDEPCMVYRKGKTAVTVKAAIVTQDAKGNRMANKK